MPRSGNDWGNIGSALAVNQLDTAELQHMLVGFGLIDGMGRTVKLDNFRYGLGSWKRNASGIGKAPTLVSVEYINYGEIFVTPYSVLFDAGNIANDQAFIVDNIYLANQYHFGIEAGFAINNISADVKMNMQYTNSDGISRYAAVKISQTDGVVYLYYGGFYVSIGTFYAPVDATFSKIQGKLVANWLTGKYVKLILGDTMYDLSTYSMSTIGANTRGTLYYQFGSASKGVLLGNVYLGYIRVTKDEP